MLGGALLLSALVGVPLRAWHQQVEGQAGGASDSEKLLLARLSDLVIPDSDTPGAVAVGVPAFVERAKPEAVEKARTDHAAKEAEADRLSAQDGAMLVLVRRGGSQGGVAGQA